MEQDKPFKTIEVVDARTKQVCKVACMSCIRGHRTTSCGIPVCRSKIFWTVKRPGRPSNSCTCRYGATGGCKCVVARSACPHKAKKGEKRSGECRCDEQGRYCCLIEPDHWSFLLSLQKPVIEFFPSREAMEAKNATRTPISFSPTPQPPALMSPPSSHGLPQTPGPDDSAQSPHLLSAPYHSFSPMPTTLTPRFGMMGIGGSMESQHDRPPPNAPNWEGKAAPGSGDFHPMYAEPPSQQESCCEGPPPSTRAVQSPPLRTEAPFSPSHPSHDFSLPQPYNGMNGSYEHPGTSALSSVGAAAFDFERFQASYLSYQFPSAVCQNCGLNGCTCKNCPPVFQNTTTGSWSQCCGKKHARDPQLTPVPAKVPRTESYDGRTWMYAHAPAHPPAHRTSQAESEDHFADAFQLDANHFNGGSCHPADLPPPGADTDFSSFEQDFLSVANYDPNEFLLPEFAGTNHTSDAYNEDDGSRTGGGGSGGCCCGG